MPAAYATRSYEDDLVRDANSYIDENERVDIPRPLVNQRPILEHEARFKIVRAGRRFGKTRLELNAAVMGHGPVVNLRDRHRMWKGLADGAQLAWIAPSYGQMRAIWTEEIMPRFAGKTHCRISQTARTLYVGNGSLVMRSADAIDSVRGMKLDGVLVDEGAFFNLDYALNSVLRHTLIDRIGWMIIVSTTKIGSDFNRLVAEVDNNMLGPDYKTFRGRTRDNPRLSQSEIDRIYASFPPGSTDLLQELEAELVEAHGTLFKKEYFRFYNNADRNAMYIANPSGLIVRHPFDEIHMYVDLAATVKTSSDYTAAMVAGLTRQMPGARKLAGVLEIANEKLEGPESIDYICDMIRRWNPHTIGIEATGYQIAAVQEIQRRMPNANVIAINVDKDKRSRAIPFAAAMARGDVFWPEHGVNMPLTVGQYLKFPNGREGSEHADEHDDIVDTGSMLATQLALANANDWTTSRIRI